MENEMSDIIIIAFKTNNGYEILQGHQPDAFFDYTIADNFNKWKELVNKGKSNVS